MRRQRASMAALAHNGPLYRWDVLNAILETIPSPRYLEIGIQNGSCGARVNAAEKWGVDPDPRPSARKSFHRVDPLPSDVFFERLDPSKRFDVVFVDGLHHADQVERDVANALHHLAPGGAVVLHDCSPLTELAQRVPRQTGVWNGDCWKALVKLRQRDDLDVFTIDADHGIGVVIPRPNRRRLRSAPDPLSYSALEANRATLLDLVQPYGWRDRYGPPVGLGKVTVVSAIYGGRDAPFRAPSHDASEYVLFTDTDGAPGWRVERTRNVTDPRALAREVKALALDRVDGDIVVWIDGRIQPTGRPIRAALRRALKGVSVAGYPHPWRRCAYAEASECAALGLASKAALDAQVAAYRAAGFPAGHGLWNTMVLARARTPAITELGRQWWAEMQRHTLRDQISLPYLLWKNSIRCGVLGPDVYRKNIDPYFRRGQHFGGSAA